MIRSDSDAALDEYSLLLQIVRDHMLRREEPGHPLVLQVQSDETDGGDHVTLVLGQVMTGQPRPVRSVLRPGDSPRPPAASLPFLAELGPLLLQALALQVVFGEQRRRMAAPLDQEAMGRLQRMRIDREIVAQLESEGRGVCSICQEAFSAGCEVYRLPCGHMFDVWCLKQWLERTRTCPNCRFVLQDVDQQYKDVVAPAWWRSTGENAEEQEGKKCQCVATVVGGEAPTHSRLSIPLVVGAVDAEVHRRQPHLPQQVLGTHHHRQQQQRPLGFSPQLTETLRTPSPVSLGSMMDRETLLESNGGYSFFSTDGSQAPRGANFEPAPPLDVLQRTGGTFREERFAEEATTSLLLAPSHLGELRVAGNVNRTPQRQNYLPVHGEQRPPPPIRWSELSLPSTGELEEGAAVSPAIGRSVGDAPFSLTQRITSEDNEDDSLESMPRSNTRSPEEAQTLRGDALAQSIFPIPQPPEPTAVVGSARHVVQALRRRRAEEVRRVRPTNSSSSRMNSHSSLTARFPPRHRPAFPSRCPLPPPPLLTPPNPSPPWIPVGRQDGVSMNSNGGSGQSGLRRPGDSRVQQGRGNHRNLARYEAVFRGQQDRRC
ncbi:zinc finger protein, predicted [Trypanosoma rangeli]|uniref:RING-type E3 ubiquitin transferase n=1 Tax=Trypanosoma rangeli TaxID=5698 RepID=A0A3R7KV37_TRYRA|nr:zinc finger protein, predicted [Trypanosoma rangeli]RNF01973.1 zinc finger protein, predicted [Trypanosoma rangeli]|eukprot:RNF01973.1 zinc finger protein, predicted [Trypanosoma rangeli]